MLKEIPGQEILSDPPQEFYWPRIETVKPPWDINVIAIAAHPSAARAILPLVDELITKGAECALITPSTQHGQERAATAFTRQYPFSRQPELRSTPFISETLSPDKIKLVVFTASGGGDETLEISAIESAVKLKKLGNKVIIVGVEGEASELVGTIRRLNEAGADFEHQIEALFLANRLAVAGYQALNFPTPKLITTGPTGFDFLHQENTTTLGNQFREINAISPDDIVIVYNAIRGAGLWSEIEIDATPKVLLSILELAKRYPDKKFTFIYRFHPDDQQPEVLNDILNPFAQTPTNLRLIIHQPADSRADSRSPLAAADLVITTVSTTNTGVALCGAKSESTRPHTGHLPLYFLSPIAVDELKKTGTILPTASQLGAAAVVNTETELLPIIEQCIFDPDFKRIIFTQQAGALRDIYRFKGAATATDRVLLQIRALLSSTPRTTPPSQF